jgi:hypothetical protein
MKAGDIVILDKDFNNSSEVEIVLILKNFAKVKSDDYQWIVMTNRLSPKPCDTIIKEQ